MLQLKVELKKTNWRSFENLIQFLRVSRFVSALSHEQTDMDTFVRRGRKIPRDVLIDNL